MILIHMEIGSLGLIISVYLRGLKTFLKALAMSCGGLFGTFAIKFCSGVSSHAWIFFLMILFVYLFFGVQIVVTLTWIGTLG